MTLEMIENRRKRLIFRSWHRGTREMDLIMGSFADRNVPGFDVGALDMYESLLNQNDPDLYNWYIGVETCPANLINPVMDAFLEHKVVT